MKFKNLFPSPLGVIFSLIFYYYTDNKLHYVLVSVSSRSYILSYEDLVNSTYYKLFKFPSPLGVIFSLMIYVKNNI